MLIVCATSEECDDVFLWLYHGVEDAERKPSFLRSRDGTILVQLSPSLSPAPQPPSTAQPAPAPAHRAGDRHTAWVAPLIRSGPRGLRPKPLGQGAQVGGERLVGLVAVRQVLGSDVEPLGERSVLLGIVLDC
jgi:hypothetical protein